MCGLLGLVLIIGSQSRGAWVVAVALLSYAAIVQVIRRMSSTKEAVAFTAAVAAVAALLGVVVYENYAAITYMMGKDPTLTNRGRIWAAVLGAISRHPLLGYGYGGFWNGLHGESIRIVTAVAANITHAHNGYLNLTLQIGLIGLGLFAFVLIVAIKNALVSIYTQRSRTALWFGSILLMIIVASSDESFLMNYNALTTILFVAACVGLRRIALGEEAG
jgi:exopolysaccharide production protein ExoQ